MTDMRPWTRHVGGALATIGCVSAAGAARAPKVPADAPVCAAPGARMIFLSPMGEPFRADAGQPYPAATWVAQADANRDGQIDRGEMIADARRFFATLDRDHDGRLTPEEVGAYEQDVAPEIAIYQIRAVLDERGPRSQSREDRDVARPTRLAAGVSNYGGSMGAGRYAWLNIPEPVASTDSDLNRVVDLAEFSAAAARRFDALDLAGSGRLRLAGLPKTPAQLAAEGPCRPRPARAGVPPR